MASIAREEARTLDFDSVLRGPLGLLEGEAGSDDEVVRVSGAEMPMLGSQDSNLDMAGQSRPSCLWTTPHRGGRAFGVTGRTRTA